jgi:hypothetical protein
MDIQHPIPQVPTTLQQIGITEDTLRNAVMRGEIARRSCTELDPPTRGGFNAWAETMRAIREDLVPKGWRHVQGGSCPTVSPDGKIAIIVQTGDEATGTQRGGSPRSKNPKGPAVLLAVANNNQRLLWGDVDDPKVPLPVETWVVLVGRDRDQVRFELSLPSRVDADGRIVEWKQRITFSPIQTEPQVPVAPMEDTGEIDIDVRKKNA